MRLLSGDLDSNSSFFSYASEFNFSLRVCHSEKKKKKKIPTIAARCIPIKLFTSPVMKGTQQIHKNLYPSLWGISWWRRNALWLYPRGPPRPADVSGPCAHEVPAFFLDPGAHEWSVPSECRVSIFPVLWSACNQALLAFKGKCSGGSSSCCQTPQAVQPDMGL